MLDFLKQGLVDTTGLSRDALHIHVGLLIMVIGFVFLGSFRRVVGVWLLVLAIAIVNELFDLHAWYGWTGGFNWLDSIHDLINTMLWPSVLLLAARLRNWE